MRTGGSASLKPPGNTLIMVTYHERSVVSRRGENTIESVASLEKRRRLTVSAVSFRRSFSVAERKILDSRYIVR